MKTKFLWKKTFTITELHFIILAMAFLHTQFFPYEFKNNDSFHQAMVEKYPEPEPIPEKEVTLEEILLKRRKYGVKYRGNTKKSLDDLLNQKIAKDKNKIIEERALPIGDQLLDPTTIENDNQREIELNDLQKKQFAKKLFSKYQNRFDACVAKSRKIDPLLEGIAEIKVFAKGGANRVQTHFSGLAQKASSKALNHCLQNVAKQISFPQMLLNKVYKIKVRC